MYLLMRTTNSSPNFPEPWPASDPSLIITQCTVKAPPVPGLFIASQHPTMTSTQRCSSRGILQWKILVLAISAFLFDEWFRNDLLLVLWTSVLFLARGPSAFLIMMYLFNEVSFINFHGYGFCYSTTKPVYEVFDNVKASSVNRRSSMMSPPPARCARSAVSGRRCHCPRFKASLSLHQNTFWRWIAWISWVIKWARVKWCLWKLFTSSVNNREQSSGLIERASCWWSEANWRSWRELFMEEGYRKLTLRKHIPNIPTENVN